MPCPVPVSMDPVLAATEIAQAKEVCLDCETTGIHASNRMVGLAIYVPGGARAFYLPTYSDIDPPAFLIPETTIVALVRMVLDDPNRVMIAHNAAFELMVFRRLGLQARCHIHDTMLGYHRLDNTFPSTHDPNAGTLNYKLKTLTRALLGVHQDHFEDVTGGQPSQMVPASTMADYACQDVYFTTQHYLRQMQQLQMQPRIRHILQTLDFPILPVVCEMLFGGIPIDLDLAHQNTLTAKAHFRDLSLQIAKVLGRPADFSKRDVLRRILVKDCGLKEAQWAQLSEKSLARMANEAKGDKASFAREFVKLVLERRKQADLLSKFFIPLSTRINPDTHLLHPGGFTMMTNTGRFSAQDPNVQAMPKRGPVRQMIIASPDERIVSIDFSNIEPRVLAQALLWYIRDKDRALKAIRQQNQIRARQEFADLLVHRKFARTMPKVEPLEYPKISELAKCFANKDGDPYVVVAERMYGLKNIDKDTRNKAKGILLATMYGQSLPGYAARMDYADHAVAADMLNRLSDALPEIGVPKYTLKHDQWVKVPPTIVTYREHIESMIRLSGQVESLFGRQRKFPGLYHLRHAKRATIVYQWRNRYYEWDVAPVQLWNFALHCYVYSVRDQKTGKVLATSDTTSSPYEIMHRRGMCYWPFRQLSYKFIRSVIIDGQIIQFDPIEDCHRQGFNAIIQMSAGDIFKKVMLAMDAVTRQYQARMFLNVHDELVFVVPATRVETFVRHAVSVMEQPPSPDFQIPIKVEVKVGHNYDLKDVSPYTLPALCAPSTTPWWKRAWQWLSTRIRRLLGPF